MIEQAHELLAAAREKHHTPVLRTKVQISARVTVFFAAAGFGKTYTMIDACARLRQQGASVAWLSCAALALPSGDSLQAIRHFSDLFADAEFVFIDDLELLPREHRKALLQAFCLTKPHRKIALATRSLDDLGLPRLLADGAVQLVQADMLHWRRRHLSELWQHRLTAKQIASIDLISQGWPAVSQLLAHHINEKGDIAEEAVLLNASLASDYIREEVLPSFAGADLTLLAMTSVVEGFDDALIGGLSQATELTCDALIRRLPGLCVPGKSRTGVTYNRALWLYLKQAFLGLDDEMRAHALRAAADWASSQGDVALAGNLAAQAGDRQRIVDYVVKAGGLRIGMTKGYDGIRTVVAAAGEALVSQEPRLKLLKCMVLLKDGRVREAMRLYQQASAALPADADTERGATFIRLSLMLYGCQLGVMSDAEVEEAARLFDQDPAYREIAPTVLAVMHSQRANFGAATAAISVARAYGREAGTIYNIMFLDAHAAEVALACGKMDEARGHLAKARLRWRTEFATDEGAETVLLSLSAQLAFECGNIRQAQRLVGVTGHRLAHSEAWLDIHFALYEPMFRLLAREEAPSSVSAALHRTISQVADAGLDRIATGLRNLGTCLLGEKMLSGAEGLALSMEEKVPESASESWQEKELRLLAAAYGGLAHDEPTQSRIALDTLVAFTDLHGLLRTKLRALLLRQVVLDLLGDGKSAMADFHAALEIGAKTGMRQAFLEFGVTATKLRLAAGVPERFSNFAKGLLGLMAASTPTPSESALTRREAQILALLTGGDSDKGIARKLQVTEHAVRFHLKNIYRKLGVHDRSSAISRYKSE